MSAGNALTDSITENNPFSMISDVVREAAMTEGSAGSTATVARALQIGDRVTWLAG